MLVRGRSGKQFWAVRAGSGADETLVLDLRDHEFSRAVLAVDQPRAAVWRSIRRACCTNSVHLRWAGPRGCSQAKVLSPVSSTFYAE